MVIETEAAGAAGAAANMAEALLATEPSDLRGDTRRFLAGLTFSSAFGLALGLRFGPGSMAAHAVGVPLALLAVAGFGGPAFYIGLLHGGLAIEARGVARAFAQGAATSGLVLAGFAPAMALLSISCEEVWAVQAYAALALGSAGLLGLRTLLRTLPSGANGPLLLLPKLCLVGFATLLSARVWLSVLPVLRGLR